MITAVHVMNGKENKVEFDEGKGGRKIMRSKR